MNNLDLTKLLSPISIETIYNLKQSWSSPNHDFVVDNDIKHYKAIWLGIINTVVFVYIDEPSLDQRGC